MMADDLACEVCGAKLRDGVSLYRQNAKGQPGIWRCDIHIAKEIDPVVAEIVEIIENGR